MKKELKKRIITSIVLIAIALNCLFINNFSWLFLLLIVSFICWIEFINLNKKIWKRKTIIILPIPGSLTPPIIYSTGILESSQHKDIANKYITYLKNNSSKILETKGFTPIKSTIE